MKKIELLNGLMKKLLAALVMVAVLEGMVGVENAYSATQITDVSWESNLKIIRVTLDAWPGTWGNWIMYVDGRRVPMEGGVGNPVIRPAGPVDQFPTGLIIGAEPWVTGLS